MSYASDSLLIFRMLSSVLVSFIDPDMIKLLLNLQNYRIVYYIYYKIEIISITLLIAIFLLTTLLFRPETFINNLSVLFMASNLIMKLS